MKEEYKQSVNRVKGTEDEIRLAELRTCNYCAECQRNGIEFKPEAFLDGKHRLNNELYDTQKNRDRIWKNRKLWMKNNLIEIQIATRCDILYDMKHLERLIECKAVKSNKILDFFEL